MFLLRRLAGYVYLGSIDGGFRPMQPMVSAPIARPPAQPDQNAVATATKPETSTSSATVAPATAPGPQDSGSLTTQRQETHNLKGLEATVDTAKSGKLPTDQQRQIVYQSALVPTRFLPPQELGAPPAPPTVSASAAPLPSVGVPSTVPEAPDLDAPASTPPRLPGLVGQSEQLKQEIGLLKESIRDVQVEIRDVRAAIASVEALGSFPPAEMTAALKEKTQELADLNGALNAKRNVSMALDAVLNGPAHALRNEIKVLERNVTATRDEVQALAQEIKVAEALGNPVPAEITQAYEEKSAALAGLEDKLQAKTKTYTNLEGSTATGLVHGLRAEISALDERLKDKSLSPQDKKDAEGALSSKKKLLEGLETASSRTQRLMAEVAVLKAINSDPLVPSEGKAGLTRLIADKEGDINDIETKKKTLELTTPTKSGRFQNLEGNVMINIMERASPTIKENNLRARVANLEKQLDALASQQPQDKAKINEVADKLTSAAEALQRVRAEIAHDKSPEGIKEKASEKLKTLGEELTALKAKSAPTAETVALVVKSATDALTTESTRLTQDLVGLKQDAVTNKAAIEATETRIKQIAADIKVLGGKPTDAQVTLLENHRNQLTRDYESLKNASPVNAQAVAAAKTIMDATDGVMAGAQRTLDIDAKTKQVTKLTKTVTDADAAIGKKAAVAQLEKDLHALSTQKPPASPLEVAAKKAELTKAQGELHEMEHKLQPHAEMAWSSVKNANLKEERLEFFMKALTDYRKQDVLDLLQQAISVAKSSDIKQIQADIAKMPNVTTDDKAKISKATAELAQRLKDWDALDKRACGSADLTSDFDATVIKGKFGMDTKVVETFNKMFRERTGLEAGSFYDTNLYVEGGGPKIMAEVKAGPKVWSSVKAHQDHDKGQDIAALCKQRLYSNKTDPQEFANYKEQLRTELTTSLTAKVAAQQLPNGVSREQLTAKVGELVNAQLARFDEASTWITERQEAIDTRVGELREDPNLSEVTDFDVQLMAMNELFVEASADADVVKKQWEGMPEATADQKAAKDLKWAEYTMLDAKAQLFANEPYFSEGPVRHVVGNEQSLKGLKPDKADKKLAIQPDVDKNTGKPVTLQIDPMQALESATENLGDSKKEFEHLKGKEMGEVALKASKYMGRLTRALEYAVPQEFRTESGMQATIDKLQGAEKELLRVRKGGALPPGETSENAYALKVMKDNGLEGITSVAELETCFRELKMKAEVEVRANAVVADALLALKGGG